jgi:hypothetical protein
MSNGESSEERKYARKSEAVTASEKFAVQVVQVVAGGALVAVIAQFDALQKIAPLLALYAFMTVAAASLALAVVAAYLRHTYSVWDLAGDLPRSAEAKRRANRIYARHHNLTWIVLRIATTLLVLDFLLLVGAFWYRYFWP